MFMRLPMITIHDHNHVSHPFCFQRVNVCLQFIQLILFTQMCFFFASPTTLHPVRHLGTGPVVQLASKTEAIGSVQTSNSNMFF